MIASQTQLPVFTASRLASALGISRQDLQRQLRGIAPAAWTVNHGNDARAWPFASLPGEIQNQLHARATQCGYRDGLHLLCSPDSLWRPRVSWNESSPEARDTAVKLRDVLTPFLERKDIETRSQAELERDGIAAYQLSFGHAITGRWFRQLFTRTIERDRNQLDWARLEIYLSESAPRCQCLAQKAGSNFDHGEIGEAIDALEDKANPGAEDIEYLYDLAFRNFEALSEQNAGKKGAIKKSICRFLLPKVESLAKSESAFLRGFDRKYSLWKANGECPSAISDLRRINSGNFRRPDFKEDVEKIRNLAIEHNGNESLAHRVLRQRGELSKEFAEYYSFNPRRNKSYVPASVRADITPEVDMCGPIHRGPHEAKMRGPYIQRDWSGVLPGQWFSADDVTWNSYFWLRDDDGQLQITRGECLLFIDLRSGYPLDFKLIAGKYNGEHIRSGILRVHDLHGLSSKLYFERSVWKSRLITGETNKALIHWRDAERGLRDYGLDLELRHATTPRAKTIEGLFRILQERQRSEIGFVGFNERIEKMERIQDIIGRCKRGTEDPRNHFLSMEQWAARISQCLTEYLADPQNGKMLDGLSPAEMWAQRQPLCKLPDEARYILATHRVRVKVRQEGIILTIRGKRLAFYNEHTGSMIGRDVFAFYNIEQPELLTVSDLNRENFFTVKQHTLPAMSATREQFAAVNKDRAGHMLRAKEIYGSIQHPERKFVVRDNAVDEQTKELGRFHNTAVQQHRQEQKAADNAVDSRVKRGLQLIAESEREMKGQL